MPLKAYLSTALTWIVCSQIQKRTSPRPGLSSASAPGHRGYTLKGLLLRSLASTTFVPFRRATVSTNRCRADEGIRTRITEISTINDRFVQWRCSQAHRRGCKISSTWYTHYTQEMQVWQLPRDCFSDRLNVIFFSRTNNCDLFLAVIDACSVLARATKYLTDEVLSDPIPTNILLLSQQTIAFIHGCFYSLHCQDHPNDTPLQIHHNLLMSICINWFDHLSVSLLRLVFFSNRSPSYWSPALLGVQLQICELFIRYGKSIHWNIE